MIRVDLTEWEAGRVRKVLEGYLDELRDEIGHTDSLEMRRDLRRTEGAVRAFLERLPEPAAV